MRDYFVAIATAENTASLAATLGIMARADLPPGYEAAFIVENGPKTGVEEVVRAADPRLRARYLYSQRGNKSLALNVAIEHIKEGLIFFADDDVEVEKGTLCAYADAAGDLTAGEFYGGPTTAEWEAQPPEWMLPFLPPSAKGWTHPLLDDTRLACDACSGAGGCAKCGDARRAIVAPAFLGFNWAAFARDLREVGGFNEHVGPGAETGATGQEFEMQERLLARGAKGRFVATARVKHRVPADRCSPQWALHRTFRNGISSAIRNSPRNGPLSPRPPHLQPEDVAWLKEEWKRLANDLAATEPDVSDPLSYEASYRIMNLIGFLKGRRWRNGAR
jgi:GT2 family glycosyltransferase